MKPVKTFIVTPSLPAALERLRDLAYNLRWSWNHETIDLFHGIVKRQRDPRQGCKRKAIEKGLTAHMTRADGNM